MAHSRPNHNFTFAQNTPDCLELVEFMYGGDINYSVPLFDFALGPEKTNKPLHHYLPTLLAHGLQSQFLLAQKGHQQPASLSGIC